MKLIEFMERFPTEESCKNEWRKIAMHLLTSTKKGISASELQKQLGNKRYEPIWAMLHKLRCVMGRRDNEYQISGSVELDDGFFTTEIADEEKDAPLKSAKQGFLLW